MVEHCTCHSCFLWSFLLKVSWVELIGVAFRISHFTYLQRGVYDHEIPPVRCSNYGSWSRIWEKREACSGVILWSCLFCRPLACSAVISVRRHIKKLKSASWQAWKIWCGQFCCSTLGALKWNTRHSKWKSGGKGVSKLGLFNGI